MKYIFLQTYSHSGSISRESCCCNVCLGYLSIILSNIFCLSYLFIIFLIFFVSVICLCHFLIFLTTWKILIAKHQLQHLFISPASTTLIVFVMITLILFGVLRIFDPARVETFSKLTKKILVRSHPSSPLCAARWSRWTWRSPWFVPSSGCRLRTKS